MEILILLLYYDRPNMVRNALESIKNLNYDKWRLAFIDDGSPRPGKPVVKEVLADHLDKVDFYHTHCDEVEKRRREGSIVGKAMNYVLKKSTSDIAIMLCDDDALYHDYFDNLNKWFKAHPDKVYCYSHVIQYNPFEEKPLNYKFTGHDVVRYATEEQNRYKNRFNLSGEINPSGYVDASQVAWRISCNQKGKIWLPYPLTSNLDAAFYKDMFDKYKRCPPSGFYGQYKGMYNTPLFIRQRTGKSYQAVDLPELN